MDNDGVVGAKVPLDLPYGLHKGQRLDVAYGAAYLGDYKIVLPAFSQQIDVSFDLIGDVGYHLHGFSQVLAFALLGDHIIIDASRGDVIGLAGGDVEKTLIMAQVQVGFRSVIGHVALPMFIGVEGPGVYINIGVKLLDGDRKAAGLQ